MKIPTIGFLLASLCFVPSIAWAQTAAMSQTFCRCANNTCAQDGGEYAKFCKFCAAKNCRGAKVPASVTTRGKSK